MKGIRVERILKDNTYLGCTVPKDLNKLIREVNFRIEQTSGQKIGISLLVTAALQELMKRADLHDFMLEKKLEVYRDKVLVA